MAEPSAHDGRRTRVIELGHHRRRYKDTVIERGEYILTADLDEVVERRVSATTTIISGGGGLELPAAGAFRDPVPGPQPRTRGRRCDDPSESRRTRTASSQAIGWLGSG